jgi:hypothetical protein
MDTDPPPPALRFELHVALTLQPDGLRPAWQADLLGPAEGQRLHFESLPALIRYLACLDPHLPASRGIR